MDLVDSKPLFIQVSFNYIIFFFENNKEKIEDMLDLILIAFAHKKVALCVSWWPHSWLIHYHKGLNSHDSMLCSNCLLSLCRSL